MPRKSKIVAAVDIGKRVSGLAIFVDGVLTWSDEVQTKPHLMARNLLRTADLDSPGLWVSEKIRDYRGKGARAADLEQLRETERALATLVRDAGHRYREIPAHTWKGSLPKPVCHRRTVGLLSISERLCIRASTKETLDAIGIGLYMTGRALRGMRRPKRGS